MNRILPILTFNLLADTSFFMVPCLTWEMSRNKLDIICRVDNVLLPISINDMFGKERGKCVFNGFSEQCISYNKSTNITASYSKKEVMLTVANVPGSVVNGKWSCIQGTQIVTTMIYTLAGIISSTQIDLIGKVSQQNNKSTVNVSCFSCRTPYGNSVEFLLNHHSVDNVRYDHDTKTCIHKNGECRPDHCSCSNSGNLFYYTFEFTEITTNISFACSMRFVDKLISSRFSKLSRLIYNGKEFKSNGSETVITKAPEKNYLKGGGSDNDTESPNNWPENADINFTQTSLWICIGLTVLILTLFLVVMVYCKSKILKKRKGEPEIEMNLTDPLLTGEPEIQMNLTDPLLTGEPEIQMNLTDPLLTERVQSEIEIAVMHSSPLPSSTANHESIEEYKIRWLLVGVGCHRIYKALRYEIEYFFSNMYQSLKFSNCIHTQTFQQYINNIPDLKVNLHYESINDNRANFGDKKEQYDYKIHTPVNLSKLCLPVHLAKYIAFNESLSFQSLTAILNNLPHYTSSGKTKTMEIYSTIWTPWCACGLYEWNAEKYESSFQLIESMIDKLQFGSIGQISKEYLSDLQTSGYQLLAGLPSRRIVATDMYTQVNELLMFTQSFENGLESSVNLQTIQRELKKWVMAIDEQINLFESKNSNLTSDRCCEPCIFRETQTEASWWCMECEEYFCSSCKESHVTIKKLREHCFVELTEDLQTYSSRFCCSKHSLNFEYLCIDHDRLCCNECIVGFHRSCKMVSVDGGCRSIKRSPALIDFIEQMHFIFERISERKRLVMKIKKVVEKEAEFLKQESLSTPDEERICQEFQEMRKKMFLEFETVASTTEEIFNLSNDQTAAFDFYKEHGTEKTIFLFIHTSKFILGDIRGQIDLLDETIREMHSKFNEKNISDQLKSNLSQEICRMISSEILTDPVFDFKSRAQFEVKSSKSKLPSFSIPYEVDLRPLQEFCIKGMVVTPNNSLLLCDLSNSRVLIWKDSVSSISTVYTPWEIACIPNQTAAVVSSADKDYVQFIDTEQKLMLRKVEIEGISGSGIDTSNDYIFVSSNSTIHVLNHEGLELKTVHVDGLTSCIQHQLFHNDNIWICEYDSNKAFCSDMEGKILLTYNSDALQNPFDILKDDQGRVFILGNGSDNVHIVSQCGKTINVVLGEDGLDKAVSFCFNKDYSKLFVSNRLGFSVLIFDVTH